MKKYFALATVATMFAACSNEVIEPQVDALTGMPIQVKTNVASLVESRVAGMDSDADFSKFYLKIEGETNKQVSMGNSSGNWVAYEFENPNTPVDDMVWTNGNAVTVSALMSGSVGLTVEEYNTTGGLLYVYEDQSGNLYKNSDMLYMKPTEMMPAGDGSITVNFSHLMSKVRISIATGSSETSDPISSVKVKGTHWKRYFVPATGNWGDTFMKAADITAHADAYTDGTSVYEVILIPQEVAENTFSVSFAMGDKNYEWTSSEAVTLESGKLYTLALQIPDTDPMGDAVAVAVNVTDWPAESVTLGGTSNDVTIVE